MYKINICKFENFRLMLNKDDLHCGNYDYIFVGDTHLLTHTHSLTHSKKRNIFVLVTTLLLIYKRVHPTSPLVFSVTSTPS